MSALVEMPIIKRERRASDVTLKDVNDCSDFLCSAPSEPLPASKKHGYVIYTDALLGEGSYSSVFEAEDVATKQIVVAKLTDVSRKTHAHCHYSEVDAFKRLGNGHPNIVHYYSDFVQNQVGIIIMEKLPPTTLEEHLSKNGRMAPREALALFKQIVSAVEFMHERNISPRDLKVENIAYDATKGIVKLFDFGLSMHLKPNEDGTMPSVTVTTGSPLYMPPEVIACQPHDTFAHDIWCLGQILYMMLVGRSPFNWCSTMAELRDELLVFKKIRYPSFLDNQSLKLLKSMLNFEAAERIDIKEIKERVNEMLSFMRNGQEA